VRSMASLKSYDISVSTRQTQLTGSKSCQQ